MYNLYFILGEALAGRGDEFDEWYIWVHTREVMAPRVPAIAAQCFRRVAADVAPIDPRAPGQDFLCLYENADPVAMTGVQGGAVPSDMVISRAGVNAPPGGGYYDTVAERRRRPGEWPDADLIVEWIGPFCDPDTYIDRRFAELSRAAGVVAGWIGVASAHQIYPGLRPAAVAVYRTTSLADSLRAWPMADGDIARTAYRQISERITRQDVLEPDVASADRTRTVRDAVLRRNLAPA